MFPWSSLPSELQFMVLEYFSQSYRRLSSAAAVCKDWRWVIEKKNFARLKLKDSCLVNFQRIVDRRRDLVRYIGLNVELSRYTCRICNQVESNYAEAQNSLLVKQTISRLLKIISTWNRAGNNLTLELSAQSPSDSKHWFRRCYFGADDIDEMINPNTGEVLQTTNGVLHDPNHGWVEGQRLITPAVSALLRVYEKINFRLPLCTPKVSAVTALVIRRHCRRRFSPATLSSLWHCFPQLQYMTYEPWRMWDSKVQSRYDEDYGRLFESFLPMRLKKLSIFEDTNEDYVELVQNAGSPYQVDSVRSPSRAVGAALATKSITLEQLSVAFMIDAACFFAACKPSWTWLSLQSLALTSISLTRTERQGQILDLLQAAGKAAHQMPILQTMVLWNGRKGEACGFIYQNVDGYRSITWRSTWDLELDSHVVETWEMVADENARSKLQVRKELLSRDVIRSHGDAIHHLKLPHGVISPESLWQIRREHEE